MHPFHTRWRAEDPVPLIGSRRFADTRDVIDHLEHDPGALTRTWAELWHLDDDGAFQCCSRGVSFDTIRTFARRPDQLLECRDIDVGHPCPDRWLIIESRRRWADSPLVSEADGQAYQRLAEGLARRGVTLLDALLIGDQPVWWSMRELTTGSTAWPSPASRRPTSAA